MRQIPVELLSALGALIVGVLGHVLADIRHRQKEHSRQAVAEREREKRATSVTLVVDDHLAGLLDARLGGIDERIERKVDENLRGFRERVDKRMVNFERYQNEMRGALSEALEHWRKNQMALLSLERQRIESQEAVRKLLAEMHKNQQAQSLVLEKLLKEWTN